MTNASTQAHIEAFFESYMAAFVRSDVAALASHFAWPAQIVGAGDPPALIALAGPDDYVSLIDRFLRLYQRAGVAGGAILSIRIETLSSGLALAALRWRVDGVGGAPLYEFDARYTFVTWEGGWRVAAIAHDETPRLLALLAR